MLWRHYHKAITRKQAKAFWKIEPRLQIEVENHSLGSLNGLARVCSSSYFSYPTRLTKYEAVGSQLERLSAARSDIPRRIGSRTPQFLALVSSSTASLHSSNTFS
jgi:hypothetical protein